VVAISALLPALRAASPRAIALQDEQRSISYGALLPWLDVEIEWLRGHGGERFALLADNGVPWVLADLALHLGGFLSVPIPPSFTPAQAVHALDDAGIDTVLTDDPDRVRAWLPGWHAIASAPASRLHCLQRRVDPELRRQAPRGTRKITYTSGSTAAPKGVCLSGAALEAIAASLAQATTSLSIERHLCFLPLATLLENVGGVYAPLLRGTTCRVPSCRVTGMSYAGLEVPRWLAAIARHAPQSLILVPELLQVLVTAIEAGWTLPASLQFVAVGGARVSSSLLARAEAVRLPVYEGYGLSECASVVCLNTPEARRAGTVGRALPHVRVRLDAEGQVHVTGASTMLGYLGEAPREPGNELATGDLGEFDEDGFLQLRGRLGNRFITSYGRNVSPEWIESELTQRLGGCPVLATGEARPYVVALVSARATELDDAAVDHAIDAANAALPDYARVRLWVRSPRPFSVNDGTLTANGRLRRGVLHERYGALLGTLYDRAVAC
jgi:long-subunit acyl-CoA synthetase (AMP-forming)